MLHLVMLWTICILPVVFGKPVTLDPTALKKDVDTILSDIEIKKPNVKGILSNHNLDGNIEGTFQLSNMFHPEDMREKLRLSSTSSPVKAPATTSSTSLSPSSSSSASSVVSSSKRITSEPLTVQTTVTQRTTAIPSDQAKSQPYSELVHTGLSRPTTKPSLTSTQTRQPQYLLTTPFVEKPVTNLRVNKLLKTREKTTDFVTTTKATTTTTGQTATRGVHVSVFRKKKAVSSETEKTTLTTLLAASSTPTTKAASSTSSKTTSKTALEKSIESKCKQLEKMKILLPKACMKYKGIGGIWN
ncbi:uncharacterized protein LOC123561543 [Mercenaria mercenaria]|uniref:uncharacterized protein LOC123561543 n=1 Tax=Mercenaria mercenaria TaxID=6596 RepID=UPI00234F1CD5|nr:uncharacterized protein LOC123561543 [Mercenaria mercenaria]